MSRDDAPARILVVDDDPDLRDLIAMRLGSAGYEVDLAASGEEALAIFHAAKPRAVITDLRMDGMDGHALFARLHEEAPSVPVIILTAHGSIPDAVSATQRGVFGFLTKPFDGRTLLTRLAEALALSPPLDVRRADAAWRKEIVAASPVMDELLRQARLQADERTPLLITGPRGSGKELLARVIHAAVAKTTRSWHVFRCATATAGDTTNDFATSLAAAEGGTLFLDDVDALPLVQQARLLPLVSDPGLFSKPSTLRIIAATTVDLEDEMRSGRFRADLYYGLARHSLAVPPLSARRDDIPLLVAHFTATWNAQVGRQHQFSPAALALLCDAPWPGNVRQLGNLVAQAFAQALTSVVPATLVRRLLQDDNAREMAAFDEARKAFERDYLCQLMKATSGNVAQAARIARRNRTEFYKLLARHDLDPATFKPSPQ